MRAVLEGDSVRPDPTRPDPTRHIERRVPAGKTDTLGTTAPASGHFDLTGNGHDSDTSASQTDRQTGRQTGRQTDKQTDRQTGRQTDK